MNKSNSTLTESSQFGYCAARLMRQWLTAKQIVIAGLALIALAMLVPAASAQTATFIGVQRIRATVPVGFIGTTTISNTFTIKTNGIVPDINGDAVLPPITVSASGLPAGVTATVTDPSGAFAYPGTAWRTNSGGTTTNIVLNLTLDGTTPEGTYFFKENVSGGVTSSITYVLDVAHIWNGSTNAAADGSGNWSDSTKWLGGSAPSGADANVIFNDAGGQSNSLLQVVGVSTNYLVNSVVNNNLTIGSLRFSETNALNRAHTVQINPGKTLTITGTNGFAVLRDYLDVYPGLGGNLLVSLVGTNGATLVVTNPSANFIVMLDNQQAHTLDMTGLDNFQATVNMLSLGDYRGYPNWYSLDHNMGNFGNTSIPNKFIPTVNLARTNIIKTSYVGPDNYTNDVTRQHAVNFLATAYGSGSSSQGTLSFGISNLIYADSVSFVGANQGPGNTAVRFNPAFANTNPVAIFRGTNGGRMSIFSIGDGAGTNGASSNVKGYVDFGSSRGRIDALVDNVYLARDRRIITGGGTPTYQGRMALGAGIFDANNVFVGYQQFTHTNTVSPYRGYCQGNLYVSNTAVLRINNTLTLGYTTETNSGNIGDTYGAGYQNQGQVSIGPGGTVLANKIEVGGITKASAANTITLAGNVTNISTLVISNTVADTNMMLGTLAMNGFSILGLNIDCNSTNPYIYVTNLTTSGGNNIIRLSTISNATYPTQVVLISYVSGTPAFSVDAPPFVIPSIVSTTFKGSPAIAVNLSYGIPKNLLWRGGNGTWDNVTKNWLDQTTLAMTNFVNGDYVAFDDVSGSAIALDASSSPLLPSAIAMTNSTLNFVFNGAGEIQGGVTLTKWGSGSLQIDVPTTASVQLNQGTLTNTLATARVANVTMASGTTMSFSGTVNAGLVSAGAAVLQNSGTINGPVVLQSGGTLVNYGNVNGVPTLQAGSTMWNSNQITFNLGGTMTVASNATFINASYITGDNITVSGTFKDMGVGTISLYNQLQIGAYALFIPGGDGIGSTDIEGIGSATYSGRVTLLANSTNMFKVNLDSGDNYTILYSGEQDFGPSQGSPAYNGCTLLITNTGITPIPAGKSFGMFQNAYIRGVGGPLGTTGTATNAYPVLNPAIPGANLAWNITNIVHNGIVSTIGLSTNAPNLLVTSVITTNGNIYTTGTNADGSFKYATNNVVFTHLTWPATNTGWRLQQQNNDLNVGLTTNWTTVFGSPWVNDMVNSNNLNTNSSTFFRLVYP